MADTSQVKEITERLEQGVKDLYTSEKYADYLKTMSRFHKYSTRNTLLIHMQNPNASLVCGFRGWQTKFGRSVRKGEKSIKILAPVPFTKREENEKLDPDTRQPIIGEDGMPVVEYSERHLARFKVTSVFDVSQTAGKPLPSLAQNLTGDVEQYNAFMDALRSVSPLPIVFEQMPEDTDGTCRFGVEIAIRAGMSEIQTVCAVIHEITHAKLHDRTLLVDDDGIKTPIDRRSEEVTAESVSYAVCQYFGIETSDNSFGYLAEWSRGRELKELNASLDTIRKTATEMISEIEDRFKEIVKDRDITLAVGEAQSDLSEPQDDEPYANEQTHTTEESANELEDDTQAHDPSSIALASSAILTAKLYTKFAELFPQSANGEYSYLRLEAGDGFMPLSIEWLNSHQVSIMHTYKLNGDLCYDPMIVFDTGYISDGQSDIMTLSAVEYEQSIPPLYQVYDADGRWLSVDGNGNEKAVFGLQKSINEFAAQWFESIGNQGYVPVAANMEIDGEEVRIAFDADSSPPDPEQIMPDPHIGNHEISEYGYAWDGMLPLTQTRATELFDSDHTIFLIYPDNTEAMIFDRDEIANHDGIFGIERTDWEASLEYAEMKAESRTGEGSREAELLHGSGNRFGIYQIREGLSDSRSYLFTPMEQLQEFGLDVQRRNYELVYSAPFTERVEYLTDRYPVLNRIYQDFNLDHPDDYKGRSISVSDIIVLKANSDISSHFVDRIGFVEIDGFLGEERAQLPEKPATALEDAETKRHPQVGSIGNHERTSVPKSKPTLAERLAENKLKAARQGQYDNTEIIRKQGARV